MPRKYNRPTRRSPASDPQQFLVYRMESESIGARNYMQLSRQSIERFVRAVCRAYKLPKIKIEFFSHRKWAAMAIGSNRIQFAHKCTSRDLITVAHELAHCLHSHIAPDSELRHEDHGPQFMACYMSVLDTCRLVPVVGMRAICDSYGIRYADPGTRSSYAKLFRVVRA